MTELPQIILTFIQQFVGGPSPPENNLVRFALPGICWAALLIVAWSRQRDQSRPRERLLLWGFGLGQAHEVVMFSEVSIRLLWPDLPVETSINHLLFEHVLAMAAILVVAGAFIRDGLDDQESARAYLQTGALVTGAGDLTGPVPSELSPLGKLKRLELEANGLSGPLPRELVTLDLEYHPSQPEIVQSGSFPRPTAHGSGWTGG